MRVFAKLPLILAAVCSNSAGFAAQSMGNGGNGVVCAPGPAVDIDAVLAQACRSGRFDHDEAAALSFTQLDLYLGNMLYDQPYWPEAPDYVAMVRQVIGRMPDADGRRRERLTGHLASFGAEATFLPCDSLAFARNGSALYPVVFGDVAGAACRIVPFAGQDPRAAPGAVRYYLNALFWNAMPETTRAALVLHEIVYRDVLERQESIAGVMPLTAFLASRDAGRMTAAAYCSRVSGLGYGCEEVEAFGPQFAALSYSESTGVAFVGRSDEGFELAYEDALEQCGGEDCFIRAAVKDGCLAMARGTSWSDLGFSGKPSRAQASEEAMLLCERPWPTGCRVEFVMCTKTLAMRNRP